MPQNPWSTWMAEFHSLKGVTHISVMTRKMSILMVPTLFTLCSCAQSVELLCTVQGSGTTFVFPWLPPRQRCSLGAEGHFLMCSSAAEFCEGALPPPAEDQRMRKESRSQETSHPKLAGVEAVCTPSSSGSLVLAVLCRQCWPYGLLAFCQSRPTLFC